MTVETYEKIGELIGNIKRDKSVINRRTEMINKDFETLNILLKRNGQPEIKLEDIKPQNRYDEYRDVEF